MGNPEGFRLVTAEEVEEFYRRYQRPLLRRVRWRHQIAKEDARDIVQDAFVLAIGRMGPDGNAAAWFVAVVDWLSLNFVRKEARRAELLARWAAPDSFSGEEPSDSAETWFGEEDDS